MIFLISSGLLFLFATLMGYYRWCCGHWQRLGIWQETPVFPYHDLHRSSQPTPVHLAKLLKKKYTEQRSKRPHQPLVGVYFYMRPVLLVTDVNLIRRIISSDFDSFTSRQFYHNELDDPLMANLFTVSGTKWRQLRAALAPFYAVENMRAMYRQLLQCCVQLHGRLDWTRDGRDGRFEVDAKELMSRYAIDTISNCAFGFDCDTLASVDDDDGLEVTPYARFREMNRRFFTVTERTATQYLLYSTQRTIGRVLWGNDKVREPDDFFMELIGAAIDEADLSPQREPRNFLQLMAHWQRTDAKDHPVPSHGNETLFDSEYVKPLTVADIARQAFAFFVGGTETVATTMAFCLWHLARHGSMQTRIRNEIYAAMQRHGGRLDFDALAECTYLGQCIKETLRMYPPLATLTRGCVRPYHIPNTAMIIPKGSIIYIPIYALHHDPEFYVNPHVFNPDRFAPHVIRNPFTYLPFGDGPRNCIAMRLALMQMQIGLATIFRHYKVTPEMRTFGERMDNKIRFDPNMIILSNINGLRVTLEPLLDPSEIEFQDGHGFFNPLA